MKKKLKNYTQFKLDGEDIIHEARMRCMKEMYAKAQPSADYDEIYAYYEKCQKEGKKPERVYERYYLSQEEFEYIRQKYIDAYHLNEKFTGHCDVIIDDLTHGCSKDKYIPEYTDDYGNWHPGHSGYEKVPKLSEQIGEDNAQVVIDFIKQRRDFYRFDNVEQQFSFSVTLTDSPTSNPDSVVEYWKSQGIDIEIDPRHYNPEDFWREDKGYLEDEDDEDSENV